MFDRRQLMGALPLLLASSALGQTTPKTVGVLVPLVQSDALLGAMQQALSHMGWSNQIRFEVLTANGTVENMRALAHDLLALKPDVLVTASTPAAQALADATNSVPIVFINIFDPVAAGFANTLERPGRNLTGIAGFRSDIAADWISILNEAVPNLKRVALAFNPPTGAAMADVHLSYGGERARKFGLELSSVKIDSVAAIDGALDNVSGADMGLIVIPHTFAYTNRRKIIDAVNARRIPAIYGIRPMVEEGGLMSFGPDILDQWGEGAWHVDQILRGAKPADLAVKFASKVTLTISQKHLSSLGLTLSQNLKLRQPVLIP
jgi:putative ABC transport system substrate-binding protein